MLRKKPLFFAVLAALATLTACGGGNSDMTTADSHPAADSSPSETGSDSNSKTPTSGHNTEHHPESSTLTALSGVQYSMLELPVDTQLREDKVVPARSAYVKAQIAQALKDTNQLRAEKGLPALRLNPELAVYAQQRAIEAQHVFDSLPPDAFETEGGKHRGHLRPDGADFHSGLDGIRTVGENIASGYDSADQTVLTQWRSSQGHYENIISEDYDQIGIGFVYQPDSKFKYYWVQIFASGQPKTNYHFSAQAAKEQLDVIEPLMAKIVFTQGKVTLSGGQGVQTNATIGFAQKRLDHGIFKKARSYRDDEGYQAIIQDPAGSSFSYQTFGEIDNAQGVPVQYVNIGQPTVPTVTQDFHATYHGVALANRDKRTHYYADVDATVDFTSDKRAMEIAFSNTKFAYGRDIEKNKPSTEIFALKPQTDINFSEHLNWDSAKHRFNKDEGDNHIHAYFYGPQGQEIGGQFKRMLKPLKKPKEGEGIGPSVYEGVFGAVKQ